MSRFYATFTRQTSYGPLKGSCFSYLFSSFQPQVFLDTERGWSCLEGQLEEANRHTTQGVCEVLSRHPRHPPLLPGSSRPLPPSPQLRRLVSSSTFSSFFFPKGPGDQRVRQSRSRWSGLEEPTLQNKVTVPRG